MVVARKKTTVYLDPALLRAVKVLAAGTGRHDYEVVEDALREYLGTRTADPSRRALRELLEQLGGPAGLADDEAQRLAYAELHAARAERRNG